MSFDKKYLKYKEKYQKLKNQIGGMFNVGDRVRVRGNKNIVVENRLGQQNYSEVEGNIVKRDVAPNGMDIYTVATEFGYALEINSTEHNINKVSGGQVQPAMHQQLQPTMYHGQSTPLPNPPLRLTSALPVAFAHQQPPDPPKFGFGFAPPPPPPQPQRKYHQYKVNSWVEVDGAPIESGVIIKADEYNFGIPVYDIRIEHPYPKDNFILEKVLESKILKRLDPIAELAKLEQIRKLFDEAKERKEMDIARFGQSAAQGNSLFAEFGQSATPLKSSRRAEAERAEGERQLAEARTRKAVVFRNDGEANFIKLREKPEQTSKFKSVLDLPNGTIVDILDGKEWNAEWEYVRYSPDIHGWVKKIYLQKQQERQLAETRREAGTRKALVFRNDGKGTFTQLRVKPNEFSTFVFGSVLFNGTIVDILEEEELNAEWQYVRYSPDRDTDIRGWVRKIYLQNQ